MKHHRHLPKGLNIFLLLSIVFTTVTFLRLVQIGEIESPIDVLTRPRATYSEEVEVPSQNGPYNVVKIIDPVTLVVDVDGTNEAVRLIGIDVPTNNDEKESVLKYTKRLLAGQKVYLEYDVELKNESDQTLAYVYLDDSVSMVQKILLDDGMAHMNTVSPNYKYADQFLTIQDRAKNAGTGFWGKESY